MFSWRKLEQYWMLYEQENREGNPYYWGRMQHSAHWRRVRIRGRFFPSCLTILQTHKWLKLTCIQVFKFLLLMKVFKIHPMWPVGHCSSFVAKRITLCEWKLSEKMVAEDVYNSVWGHSCLWKIVACIGFHASLITRFVCKKDACECLIWKHFYAKVGCFLANHLLIYQGSSNFNIFPTPYKMKLYCKCCISRQKVQVFLISYAKGDLISCFGWHKMFCKKCIWKEEWSLKVRFATLYTRKWHYFLHFELFRLFLHHTAAF